MIFAGAKLFALSRCFAIAVFRSEGNYDFSWFLQSITGGLKESARPFEVMTLADVCVDPILIGESDITSNGTGLCE
jgi:hypothetical protein